MGDDGMMAEKAQDALAATPAEGAKAPTVPAAMTPAASAPAPAKKSAVPDAANFRVLEEAARAYLDDDEWAKIDRAYHFAADYHRDQRRRSGEPYINHPVEVALILCKDLHMDEDTICAALLHDTVEDTPATLTQISDLFGETVAELVDGVTKVSSSADPRSVIVQITTPLREHRDIVEEVRGSVQRRLSEAGVTPVPKVRVRAVTKEMS